MFPPFSFDIIFLSPEFLWLGILWIPVFIGILSSKKAVSYFRIPIAEKNPRSFPWIFLRAFLALGIVFSSAALLSDPRYQSSETIEQLNGIDVAFVLDLSKSMLAEDMSPNRLEAAKKVLSHFVAGRNGDRFALVGFAGKPFLFSPLTDSKEAFSGILSKITTDSIKQEMPGLSGTNMGDALLLGTESLSGANREKIIVLVTDGEANIGFDPKTVAAFAAKSAIRIFSVGIGDPNGIDLFVTHQITGEKQYFLGPDGKPIRAIVDEALLRYISSVSSGEYGLAKDAASLLRVFEKIDQVTKKPVTFTTKKRYSDARAPFFLLLCIAFPVFAYIRPRGAENQFS